ncbi:hypothetical protein [Marinomonas fungiae]|uniref:Uncharacterized protein n=1 Tax=Marinomonas fungiae TaxID=1137284 RepID=A0A0K6IK27_9GAMM|nr:hypothetical protein [Marinomonas fungiae]CUB03647.1 hypothetical protein Ga0061065_10478 [Marinomonas fungiae]
MSYVRYLSGNRALGIKFYELAAQQVAQPLWYAWSLTDEELRDLLAISKKSSSIFSNLGFSLVGTLTVQNASETLIDASKKALKELFQTKLNPL